MNVRIQLDKLNNHSNKEYVSTLLLNGNIINNYLYIDKQLANNIRQTFNMEPYPEKPIWNCNCKSRCLGDTVAKVIHYTGLDKFKPSNCNCEKRQEALNELLPYGVDKQPNQ